jgi:predicted CopG family antitoxin
VAADGDDGFEIGIEFHPVVRPVAPAISSRSLGMPREAGWTRGYETWSSLAPLVILTGMKTAISIPDDVFAGAERLAKRTKKSRSQLFSDAVREYLARHTAEEVTVCAAPLPGLILSRWQSGILPLKCHKTNQRR